MKKFASALVAMFLVLMAATAFAADMRPASEKATLGQVEDILNRQMSQVDARLRDLKTQLAWKANANQVASVADLNAVRQAIDDRVAVDKVIKGRLNRLKMAVKADRADIEALIKEVKSLRGVSVESLKMLNDLVTQVAEVQSEQKAQGQRVTGLEVRATGIEVRQNTSDTKIENLNTRVSVLESSSWKSELRIGAETGRNIATASTDFVLGYATTSGSGVGWSIEAIVGAGDVVNQPHFTSAVIRAGVKSSIGSPDSPLSANLGFLFGTAAKTSLALDAGFAGGASAGLTYKPRSWPVGFTANVGQVFGRFEGLVMSAGAFFDPLGLANLGK